MHIARWRHKISIFSSLISDSVGCCVWMTDLHMFSFTYANANAVRINYYYYYKFAIRTINNNWSHCKLQVREEWRMRTWEFIGTKWSVSSSAVGSRTRKYYVNFELMKMPSNVLTRLKRFDAWVQLTFQNGFIFFNACRFVHTKPWKMRTKPRNVKC